MTAQGFALFDTAIGRCGIAWSARGVVAVQLPEATDAATRARLSRRFPAAQEATPTPEVARAIDGIIALTHGEARNLSDVVLDLERVPEFDRRVYEVARTIAPGRVLTYGAIAAKLGNGIDARDVGAAMGRSSRSKAPGATMSRPCSTNYPRGDRRGARAAQRVSPATAATGAAITQKPALW